MISLAAARRRILAQCERLHPVAIPVEDALGLVTSISVSSDEAVPPFPNTAMDGFAVRSADTAGAPVELRVVGTLRAGMDPSGFSVGPGEAVRIMTGAPIPAGADAVVMVERTAPAGDETVRIEVAASAGDHVRVAGEDLAPGAEVFPAFTVLGPGHLGVLATAGLRRVPVFPRPRVGVLSTGDELVDGPEPLRPGQIRDANRRTLLALVARTDCTPVDLGLVPDHEEAIEAALADAVSRCDVVLTSGGVSVGDFDYVKVVLDRLSGGAFQWMQVAIRPAKPLAFGLVRGVPVFGLPGNPVSSMVSYELFARPAIRQMMGFPDEGLCRPEVEAVADEDLLRATDGKTHFVRVVCTYVDGRYHVRSAGGQGSHLLRAMALSNALAVLPDGDGAPAGSPVTTILLTP